MRGGGRAPVIHYESEAERLDREQAEGKEREIERGREGLVCRMKEAERLRQREVLAKGIQSKRVKVEFSAQVGKSPVYPLSLHMCDVLSTDQASAEGTAVVLLITNLQQTSPLPSPSPPHTTSCLSSTIPSHCDPLASSSGCSAGEASSPAEGEGRAAEEGPGRGPDC